MSLIIGRCVAIGAGGGSKLEFEYSGNYNERLEDGVVELLTTGVLILKNNVTIDAFLVGGGGSGGQAAISSSSFTVQGAGGGGSGYTKTIKGIELTKGTQYTIVIGSGGAAVIPTGSQLAGKDAQNGNTGGSTTAFGSSAPGGVGGYGDRNGGAGGSGGGSAISLDPNNGGSDGSNGKSSSGSGGSGQGTTTREFGEITGKLYAGGGSGGGYKNGSNIPSAGGDGGGGNGGWYQNGSQSYSTEGQANTGSGGGGGGSMPTPANGYVAGGAAGGSGIVCIRLSKS